MVDTVITDTAAADTTTTETNTTATETQAVETQQTNAATETQATTTTTTEQKAAPDDWATLRAKIAGEDEKVLKRLSRYGTLEEAIRAGVEAQNKIGSIKAANKPGKDATPEEMAAYREANGIPESPDKYEVNLPNGIVVGEADKPFLDAFLKTAHEENLTPAQVNKLAATQLELKEKEVQARAEKDAQSLEEAQKALNSPEVWGSEAKLNINMITSLLDTAPKGVKEQLLGARMGDGTPLGNHVDTLKWLASIARERNPLATVVPGSGSNAQQALESEMMKLEKMMTDSASDYWKGPAAEKNQARYRDLVNAKMNWDKKKG
jgi:hypothetical protein